MELAPPLTINDAHSFIKYVNLSFDRSNEFMQTLDNFHDEYINFEQLQSTITTLFEGRSDLILGFNVFLPRGRELDVPQPQASLEEAVGFLERLRSEEHELQLKLLDSYRKKEISVHELHQRMAGVLSEDMLDEFKSFLPVEGLRPIVNPVVNTAPFFRRQGLNKKSSCRKKSSVDTDEEDEEVCLNRRRREKQKRQEEYEYDYDVKSSKKASVSAKDCRVDATKAEEEEETKLIDISECLEFAQKVKDSMVNNVNDFKALMKILGQFISSNLKSVQDLRRDVWYLFEKNDKDLWNGMKRFFPPTVSENEALNLDLQDSKKGSSGIKYITPNYIVTARENSQERDALADSVLNYVCKLVDRDTSDTNTNHSFEFEDKMNCLDVLQHKLEVTVKKLEKLRLYLEDKDGTEEIRNLDDYVDPECLRCILELYSYRIFILKTNALDALPIILERLKQKREEVFEERKCVKEAEKIKSAS